MSELSKRIANLPPERLALFLDRLGKKQEAERIPKRAPAGRCELSFAQEEFWLLDRLRAGSGVNTFRAVRLSGRLDIGAFDRALDAVVSRHEVLRTSFGEEAGRPFQVFNRGPRPRAVVISLAALNPDLRAPVARALAVQAAQLRFDLAAGPLLRVWLLRLEEEEQVLLVTLHHIVSDGWSSGVLIRDLASCYAAELGQRVPPLPELPVQYADFAVWQRRRLAGDRLLNLLQYWRERIADLPTLELPTDRPRTAVASSAGASVAFTLAGGSGERLEALARRAGTTLFAALAALLQTLLSRYSGQRDLALGTPVAGRNSVELEDLIGCFINPLVLRLRRRAEDSFLAVLQEAREVSVGALAHQELPFAKLLEDLGADRSGQQTPLFQVMLVLQNTPVAEPELDGLRLIPFPVDGGLVALDLQFEFARTGQGLLGRVEFRTDLFDRATVRRWVTHFEALVGEVVRDPAQPVEELSILPAAERLQLLREWNDTRRGYGSFRPIHLEIAARAEEAPERTALVFEGRHLTYGELERRVVGLARRLRVLGVGPEVRAAVEMERSLELVIATVAVLRSGGAYVPLDPAYPPDRLAFMVEDAGAPVLLTQRHLLAGIRSAAATVLCVDDDPRSFSPVPPPADAGAALGTVDEMGLVYVIYTSGSTGRPKGAMNMHGAVRNRLFWMQEAYGLTATDRVMQKTPFSFDVSVWELFWPLIQGACMVLAKPGGHQDPAYLNELVQREGVTTMHFVPSMLDIFLEHPGAEGSTSLRRVVCSGEALPQDSADRFQALIGCGLHNLYGPTEAAVDVTAAPCGGGGRASSVTIGRPIANLEIYLLDRDLRPVPIGIPGELYIGGAGLGRGYLARPALTAERFVPDGIGTGTGARLYRTGDLARHLPDGRIQFLGRIDQQLKLRGFRIELGEIEAVLRESPSVADAAVTGRRDAAGDLRLVAYLVPRGGGIPAADELNTLLRSKLPSYMIPSIFVTLDHLPLSPSGKLDHRALPDPDAATASGGSPMEARTPTEEILAGFWAEILRLPQVGPGDDFFALGGHSLRASQLVARIRSAYGIEVPLPRIFEFPVLSKMAAMVDTLMSQGESSSWLPPLVPVPRSGSLPLSFAQQRFWFAQQVDAASGLYNLALTVALDGALEVGVLGRSLSELLRRHEVLRTTIRTADGEAQQVILPPAPALIPIVDLSALPGEEVTRTLAHRLAWEEADRPFDLATSLPIRLCLLRLQRDHHWALLTVHHVATDGWSMDILFDDFGAIYSAFLRGEPSPLPELPVQYADYAVWQRSFLQGELLTRNLAFWRSQLEGMPHTLNLPTDRPQPVKPTLQGGRAQLLLDPALYRAVTAFSRREGVTLFMVMLSALQVLLARISGQPDFAIGTLVAGRTQPETEGLIGALVNSLVLRTRLDSRPTGHDLLLRVRETCLSAFTHQQLPFDRLVEELQPSRDAYRTPLFQVVMLLQNFRATEVKLPGLSLSPVGIERQLSAFDLTLAVEQNGDDLGGALEYRAELFDVTTAQRMLGHLANLLSGLVEHAGDSVFDLPLLTLAERQQIFREWNPADIQPPAGGFLDLFAAQVELQPDALALSGHGEQLSYGALDRLSDRLARALVERGIDAEAVVAVWMERTVEMAAALLGVLKAGGAFLPLDPAYPRARLEYLLEDSRSRVLLARSLLPNLYLSGVTVVAPMEAVSSLRMTLPLPRPDAEDSAYTIYTSGSTGRPKGVVVPHGPLASYAREMVDRFHLVGGDRVLQFASPSFDVMIEEFFPAWAAGACVVLARAEDLVSPRDLTLALEREQVTLAEVPTAYWHEWVRQLVAGEAAPPVTLRRLLIGGEAVSQVALAGWLRFGIPVSNAYGLTEVTVTSAVYDSEAGTTELMPIGRPVGNTRLDVLDRWGSPMPMGVPGELHIAGEGLARGYFGRPDATAERFLPDPEARQPGRRRYRTGDLARYRSDGNVEFLGRIDEQVKVRGFRIELGEIESALRAHPAVGDAVVVVREHHGDRRLAAYLSPGAGFMVAESNGTGALLQSTIGGREKVTQEALRSFLAGTLPEYMVPSTWMALPALPRTPNGKSDRRNLPAPDLRPESSATMPLRAGLPVRDLVATIWSEVLGPASAADLEGDFFALGGHSLLAMKLFARLHGAFGTHLPIALIFEAPTLGRLAERIEEELRRERDLELPPLARTERTEPPAASFAQQRLWYLDQLDPGNATYNVAVALRFEGRLDLAVFEACVGEIVRRHEVLRTTFFVRDGVPVQIIGPPGKVNLAVVDLSEIREPLRRLVAKRLVIEDRNLGFDLARGPLLRVSLLRLAESQGILLFCAHHIVCDGWSASVFVRELATLYAAFSQRLPSPLPDLVAQYADYAVWQRGWFAGGALERHLLYWQQTLRPLPPPLCLPSDRERQAAAAPDAESRSIILSPDLSATMRAMGRERGCSLFILVTAAFQALLASVTGQTDFILGTNVANRGLAQLEPMIGFFVNQLPLRADLALDPSFGEILHRVRTAVLEAWAHQDVPFEMVVEAVRPERGGDGAELFQAKIDFDTVPEDPEIPGVRLQVIPVNRRLAHVDLLMIVEELDPEIGISLDYRIDRFLPSTIDRWLRRFKSLLRRVVADPDLRLSALSAALGEEEREKLATQEPALAEASLQKLRSLRGRAARS